MPTAETKVVQTKKTAALAAVLALALLTSLLFPAKAEAGYIRLAGPDRYQTAVAVSQKGWEKSNTVVLVRGDRFAEALCAGPLAVKLNAPLLYTEQYYIGAATIEEIKRLGVSKAVIIGGYDLISHVIEQNLYTAGVINIERIYGRDAYETSVEIAKRLGSKEVALASAAQYADSLSIAAIASAKGFAILLTAKDSLPEAVKNHLSNYKIGRTYIIGGTEVIAAEIEKLVPAPLRLAGKDRYHTNCLVINNFAADLNFNKLYAAVGEGISGYADSLAGVVLAAKTSSPIILNGKDLPQDTMNLLRKRMTAASYVVALGGEGVVPYRILEDYEACAAEVTKTVFTQKGTYGPAAGKTTISGSLVIEGQDILVQNTDIEGDLVLGSSIGSGNVELSNVTVKGRTTVRGGGEQGIKVSNFTTKYMTIDALDNYKIAVRLKGKSKVEKLSIESDCLIDDTGGSSSGNSSGFMDVEIAGGREVSLAGSFNTVGITAGGVVVKMQDATVKTLNAKSRQIITGSGKITTANVTSDGVEIYFYPSSTVVAKGYVAYVGGNRLTEGTTKSGGTTGSPSPAPITDLTAWAGNGQVTFTFSPPAAATGVRLERSRDGSTWETVPISLYAGSTSAVVGGLLNGQEYSFRLVVSGGNRAGISNVVKATPRSDPITNLAARAGDKSVTLTFDQPVGAASVVLEQSSNGGLSWSPADCATLNSDSNSAIVSGLSNGVTYNFRLHVVGGSREGYSNIVSITLPVL